MNVTIRRGPGWAQSAMAGSGGPQGGPAGGRGGFTLSEMLVTIVVGSVVLLLGTQLLHTLLRADRGLFRWGTVARQLSALESQFRADVQRASAATWSAVPPNTPGEGTLALTLPASQRVEYQVERGRLIRRLVQAERGPQQQVYWLPAGGRWTLAYDAGQQTAEVRAWHLQREPTGGEPGASPRSEFRIIAGLRGTAARGPEGGGVE